MRLAWGLAKAAGGAGPTKQQVYAVLWVSVVSRYLALHRDGVIPVAFRYEALAERPRETLAAVFAHAGLPPESAGDAWDAVGAADSQEGSALGRDRAQSVRLDGKERADVRETVRALVAMSRAIRVPGFVAPGTHAADTHVPDAAAGRFRPVEGMH